MKYFFIILISIVSLTCFAQKADTSFHFTRIYNGDIVNAAIDNLDNLYIVSSNGQVKKIDAKGDSIAVYNQVRNYGQLSAIDVSNPLKILLFYKDFSTVVILDRLLTVRSSIDLHKYSILQPAAIGLSYDNNIWVFDEYDNKLKKIDEQGNKLMETSDLRSIHTGALSPSSILNDNGFVYLADKNNGIFVFDNYGSFKRRLDIKSSGNLDVVNGLIISTNENSLSLYDPNTFNSSIRTLPSSFGRYIKSLTVGNRLLLITDHSLRIYQFHF